MSIKRTDRMREVLSLLRDRGEVSSTVLCAELRVSVATLRRDLAELEEQGLLVRTHGGARALDPSGSEIPVRLRDHRMVAVKRRIAQHAAALVPPGPQAVALTGGVTTGEVARALKGRPNITIVTNSLTIAADGAVDAHMKVGPVPRSRWPPTLSASSSPSTAPRSAPSRSRKWFRWNASTIW